MDYDIGRKNTRRKTMKTKKEETSKAQWWGN